MNLNLKCPTCKVELDKTYAVSPDRTPPNEGDVHVCGCGAVSIFTSDSIRPMTPEEFKALDLEERTDLEFAVRNLVLSQKRNGK